MIKEEWRDIVGYEGFYKVSNLGNVMRVKAGRGAKPNTIRRQVYSLGYCYVMLCKCAVQKRYAVHRLVAAAFIGECPDGYEVNHIDCNKENNRVDNLEYVTPLQNIRHAIEQGRFVNRHGRLSVEDIKTIIALHSSGQTQTRIAERYNISQSQVSLIVKRKQYTNYHID